MTTEHPQKKFRSVKLLREDGAGEMERQISPTVLRAATEYYSQEELEKMAARRMEVRRRWTMQLEAEFTRSQLAVNGEPDGAINRSTPPLSAGLPLPRATMICPTCKIAVNDDAYGYVRDPDKLGSALPCPQCSPRVKALRVARRTQENLHGLLGGANIPDMAWGWTFETFPEEGDQTSKREAQAFANQETLQRGLYL